MTDLIKLKSDSQTQADNQVPITNRIKFITPSKQIESLSLNPITQIGNFQSLNQDDELKKTREDIKDYHYQFLADILASKKSSGLFTNRKYLGPAITDLHFTIFGNKGAPDKNDKIDNIIDFYTKKYVPRQSRNHAAVTINVTDIDITLKSNSNVFGVTKNDYLSDDDSEEEIDF